MTAVKINLVSLQWSSQKHIKGKTCLVMVDTYMYTNNRKAVIDIYGSAEFVEKSYARLW